MTRVAILWHMHQPFYQDLETGEHILPWVRLHALKDYYGMVALLREFPGVKVTFNLVPSLLVQLEAFARDEAHDRHLEIGLKPADTLTAEDRAFCVEQFFHAQRPRMIEPYPRYAELLVKREGSGLSAHAQAARWTVDELRDLQVWHKLAWVDPFYLDDNTQVRALVQKGRGFSEEDKSTLRAIELEILGKVIPEYRDAAAMGQAELSTSPFYHPILPLLCDSDVYLRTHPHSRMPRERFRRPGDASVQIERAMSLHHRLFGSRPAGMWPSEGSVSDEVVSLAGRAGLQWIATDEAILGRSLNVPVAPEALYRPYEAGETDRRVGMLFRDHTLSDLIGFHYASWSPEDAADDFIRRIAEAGDRFGERTGEEATVTVILDGENAWEHYEGGGRPFLRALYGRLERHSTVRTVTMGEACSGRRQPLSSVFPGSWIDGDFYIWIGHDDDRRAWDQLSEARRAFDKASTALAPERRDRAFEELLIAEGSDWCWWYGDDHSSEHDLAFDELFRRHVRNVYRALDLPIPQDLFVSNITTAPVPSLATPPIGPIAPTIDGEITNYFEWLGAGAFEVERAASTMHQVSSDGGGIALVEFGCGAGNLFVRIEAGSAMGVILASGVTVGLTFLQPKGREVSVAKTGTTAGVEWAAKQILELRVPLTTLGVQAGDTLAFIVWMRKGGQEIEHHPRHRPIEFVAT
jgi:alpha-amylase/alpha-mannosidase (GH57 family)